MTNTIPESIDEEEDDVLLDEPVDTSYLRNPLRQIDAELSPAELAMKPGGGMRLVPEIVPVPKQKPKRGNKRDRPGKPRHEPTPENRKYVIKAMVNQGLSGFAVANALGLAYNTLVKYYHREMAIAEDKKDQFVDQGLYLDAVQARNRPELHRAREFYYKRHNKVKNTLELDHTSSDGSMSPSPAVLLMPPSPHIKQNEPAQEASPTVPSKPESAGSSTSNKQDKPVKKPVKKPTKKPTTKKA